MKALAISGSLREGSLNTKLLNSLCDLSEGDFQITIYDGVADLPHFNADLDVEEVPPSVQRLRTQLSEADAVIISSPEYAHGVPGSFKNALDWVVSSGEFVDKPVLLINVASTGGERAQAQILQILKVMTADVVAMASFTSAQVRNGLDDCGKFKDLGLRDSLVSCLNSLR
jgi:chromate reductase, NAD(P)H dehydrogenase (quinone)